MAAIDLTDATFEKTVSQDGIVLVDFWAAWCGPCRMFAPIFDKAAEEHPDIVFAKMDTEANQQVPSDLHITAIPTLMAFRDGIMVFNQSGALPAPELKRVIEGIRNLDMDAVRARVARGGVLGRI